MKLGISINDNLMKRIDSFCEKNYLNRSAFFTQASTQFLNANEMHFAIQNLSIAMQKIADEGVIDEESQKELEEFTRFVEILTGK